MVETRRGIKPLTESQIHLALMGYVNSLNKDISRLVFHFPQEGRRDPRTGALLKRMGMKRGVPDIFIMLRRASYPGAWIELKTVKGKLTPEQKQFLIDAEEQGYFTAVTFGLDEALKIIDWYIFKSPSLDKST